MRVGRSSGSSKPSSSEEERDESSSCSVRRPRRSSRSSVERPRRVRPRREPRADSPPRSSSAWSSSLRDRPREDVGSSSSSAALTGSTGSWNSSEAMGRPDLTDPRSPRSEAESCSADLRRDDERPSDDLPRRPRPVDDVPSSLAFAVDSADVSDSPVEASSATFVASSDSAASRVPAARRLPLTVRPVLPFDLRPPLGERDACDAGASASPEPCVASASERSSDWTSDWWRRGSSKMEGRSSTCSFTAAPAAPAPRTTLRPPRLWRVVVCGVSSRPTSGEAPAEKVVACCSAAFSE